MLRLGGSQKVLASSIESVLCFMILILKFSDLFENHVLEILNKFISCNISIFLIIKFTTAIWYKGVTSFHAASC